MTISNQNRPRIWNTALTMVAVFGALLISAGPAAAQVESIDAAWMTITRDIPLRCGELSKFYKVADLERGDVVRVDGRSNRWARVIYPEGQIGFVRNEDAEDVRDGTLTVSQVNSIKAPNQISGLVGSWRSIYLGKIKPGTRLKIVGQAESKNGQRIGYRIAPPMPPAVDHPPYGYVQLAALREATKQEIESHLASLKSSAGQSKPGSADQKEMPSGDQADEITNTDPNSNDPEQIENSVPVNQPNSDSGTESATEQPGSEPDPQPQAEDTSLIEEIAVPTAQDLAPAGDAATETDDSAAAEQPSATTPTNSQTTQPAPAVVQAKRDYLLWSELETTLKSVRRSGGSVLESSLEELIAEYERSLTNADTPAARAALSSRLEWLRVRKAARDQRREIMATLEQAKTLRTKVSRERTQWQSTRGYDMVGRLVTSAIYDGTRLPRMYRIVTEGESGLTRTIGYVRDDPNLNLNSLLGSVVGVAGRAQLDDALRLRVITPTRIDRFRPTNP